MNDLTDRVINNHMHHPPTNDKVVEAHEQVRELTKNCALGLVDVCPNSRELSLALTKLEEVMFWANAAIARYLNDNKS